MAESSCPFCSIASKDIKSYIVYEDEHIISVLDINPSSRGHVLIFTKKHYNSIFELPEQEYSELMTVVRAVSYSLLLSQGATNVDILYTHELRKGSFTPHTIVHAIPRYQNDEINYGWRIETPTEEEFSSVAENIKNTIDKIKSSGEQPQPAQVQERKEPAAGDVSGKEEKKQENPPEAKRRVVIF